MPPHCDAIDGPVVEAARRALEEGNVDIVLAYAPEEAEREIIEAFEAALSIRGKGPDVAEVADRHFFETVVRLHRAGEGEPFTGLKPAGLDVGPVIPRAEAAIASGSVDDLAAFLTDGVHGEVVERFEDMKRLEGHAGESVPAARRYVSAMLGLQVWSHTLYGCMHAPAHGAAPHAHDAG